MKRIISFSLIVFLASGVFAQVGTLTVTNVDSEAGTGITVVDYEFTGDAGTYDISAEVSFNNGANYSPIPGADLTGQLTDVIPGTYSLTWYGNDSFPETFSDETIVKITAEFTWQCDDDITFTYRGSEVTYGTIPVDYGGTVGEKCWLDRNLGATRPAESSDDHLAYGDLFQWGRLDDGHQVVTWTSSTTGDVTPTTTTLSTTDVPGHGEFITTNITPYDWRADNNNNRWNANPQENNPCPPGWLVPTEIELNAERQSWGTGNQNSAGAYASTLKWPVGGHRELDGKLSSAGSNGYVRSSSVDDTFAKVLTFDGGGASMPNLGRAYGMSVRCVREL